MPVVSDDAGAFALRILTSGYGARSAGATAGACFEPVRGTIVCGEIDRGPANTECVDRGFIGDVCACGSDCDICPEGVCRFGSRFLLGHGFGALPAPGGSS